jgi:tripartite-type tricarboxylate transporter receptor subunit TctC
MKFLSQSSRKFCSWPWMVVLAALLGSVGAVQAQDWPSKPIRLIAPQAPGGGPERVIRGIANRLSQRLGQPVVVDYKPGAAGNLGAAELARSQADGYTWMLGTETIVTLNPLIYKSTGFNKSDVVPINLVASLSQLLACNPKVGVKSVPELINKAKTQNLSYASSGAGSPGHFTMEMVLDAAKVNMTHVPYRGPAPAVQDLISGQVDCAFLVTAIVGEHIKSGRLVALATSSKQRLGIFPEVPTMQEQGFPGFDATFWLAVFAPKGLKADVQTKFARALDESIRAPEVTEAMAANNTKLEGTTAEAAQKELDAITKRWEQVAKRINLKLD